MGDVSIAASESADLAILSTEVTLVGLLAIAAAVAILVSRIKVPFTVALVLVGLALSFTTAFDINLSKELILGVLVPPLVFEATMHLPWHRLKTDLVAILTLAIGGTLIGTFLVGVLIRPFVEVPWPAALAFGALVSATDPVAVIARFRSLGVDKRLTTLVEGESLFNDGAAIVIFGLAAAGSAGFTVGGAVGEFLKVSVGGLAVGAVLGYLVSRVLLKHLDDHLLETAITLALAFGSYVVAEKLHISGILAVVAAGIIVGEVGLENTSPTTRLSLENFWELLSFVVNAFVFLLIGLRIDIAQMSHHVPAILVAVVTILVARAVIVYGTSLVQNRISTTRYLPRSFQHAVYWGGLRGAVSLALALTLPFAFDARTAEVLQVMTFGVVLFTLLVQGTTIKWVLDRVGISRPPAAALEHQRRQARLFAAWAGRKELGRLHDEEALQPYIWQTLDDLYRDELDEGRSSMRIHLRDHPELETAMLLRVRADLLRAERAGLADAVRRGLVSAEVADEVTANLDTRLAALDFIRARLVRRTGPQEDA
ncbi:MAG: Na+/H+ antiporter [bacterium]|nr:Na+/H+ antiporter [bacterium]